MRRVERVGDKTERRGTREEGATNGLTPCRALRHGGRYEPRAAQQRTRDRGREEGHGGVPRAPRPRRLPPLLP